MLKVGVDLDSFQLLSNIYMLGLGCGIWSKFDVIVWCDKVIESKTNPPYEIIKISLMSNARINDIEGKLFEICKEALDDYPVKLMLSVINEKLFRNQIAINVAIKCSSRLLVHTDLSWEKEYYNLYNMDDSYDMAVSGVHFAITDVAEAFLEDIRTYSKYFNEFHMLYLDELNTEWHS